MIYSELSAGQKQTVITEFILRGINCNCTSMVDDMRKAAMDGDSRFEPEFGYDCIENEYLKPEEEDCECDWECLNDGEYDVDLCECEEYQEIYEWYMVDDWLYSCLSTRKEPVVFNSYGYFWGRTCTGQAWVLDRVIISIFEDMDDTSQNFWAKKILGE